MSTQPSPGDSLPSAADSAEDRLPEIDLITQEWQDDQRELAEALERHEKLRSRFSDEFNELCQRELRPAMDAVIVRLRRDGGDGLIVERPADARFQHTHRLTLWMSLSGEFVDAPREDRHPYLQFDADVERQLVKMSEGDMWQGHGGNRSGEVGERPLSEVNTNVIIDESIAILARAAGHPLGRE
jgi:hypothetical protein